MARTRFFVLCRTTCLLLVFIQARQPPLPVRVLDKATEEAYAHLLDRYRADDPNVIIDLRNFWAPVYSDQVMDLEEARLIVHAPPDDRVALAAMAQTDLALAAMHLERRALANQDLFIAGLLIDRLERQPQFAREWHHAIICLRMGQGDEHDARELLRRASERYPDDPELLLIAGIADEMTAARMRFDPRLSRGGTHASEALIERNRFIVTAISTLREAIARDSQAVEARIHLAYLLSAQGEHAREEALTLLREASALAANPTLKYLAALFAGDIEEKRGDLAAASISYRTAIATCPRAQTARLAFSHVQLNQFGNEQPAQNTLRPLISGPPPADDVCEPDPWRIYRYGHAWRFAELVKALRKEARQMAGGESPSSSERKP